MPWILTLLAALESLAEEQGESKILCATSLPAMAIRKNDVHEGDIWIQVLFSKIVFIQSRSEPEIET